MSAAPQFSVIIPTYNRSGTIIRAVESVLRQTCADFEIIVVDDGSTDDTRSRLLSLKDPRLATLVISNSGGPARPRNAGARMARGSWLCFLDSDDWWTADKLEKTKGLINLNPDTDLVYHGLTIHRGSEIKGAMPLVQVEKPVAHFLLANLHKTIIANSSVVVRKTLIEKIGGFNEDPAYHSIEDFDAWVRVARISENFRLLPENLGGYSLSPDSIVDYSLRRARNLYSIVSALVEQNRLSSRDKTRALSFLHYQLARAYQHDRQGYTAAAEFMKVFSWKASKMLMLKSAIFSICSLTGWPRI